MYSSVSCFCWFSTNAIVSFPSVYSRTRNASDDVGKFRYLSSIGAELAGDSSFLESRPKGGPSDQLSSIYCHFLVGFNILLLWSLTMHLLSNPNQTVLDYTWVSLGILFFLEFNPSMKQVSSVNLYWGCWFILTCRKLLKEYAEVLFYVIYLELCDLSCSNKEAGSGGTLLLQTVRWTSSSAIAEIRPQATHVSRKRHASNWRGGQGISS